MTVSSYPELPAPCHFEESCSLARSSTKESYANSTSTFRGLFKHQFYVKLPRVHFPDGEKDLLAYHVLVACVHVWLYLSVCVLYFVVVFFGLEWLENQDSCEGKFEVSMNYKSRQRLVPS